ncbi:MAG: WYL domain-containing protein [Bacteroidales bacterium]|nr:WYL domain-containing protein [Bacteroidales bacterium]
MGKKSDELQIERLLKILLRLSNGGKFTASELCNYYDISRRTFFRDTNTLRNVGFALEQKEGYYWIDKNNSQSKNLFDLLYFTEEEAFIIRQAIHSIDETNVLKQNLVNKLYDLYSYGKVAEVIVRREHTSTVHELNEAINKKQQVRLLGYYSSNSNTISDRLVEPVSFTTNFIALWAFDVESQSNKIFKIARISRVEQTGQPYQYEHQHQAQEIDVFRISSVEKIPVKLMLTMRAYNLLTEEYPLAAKYLTSQPGNRWLFDGWVCGFEGIGRFVLGLCEEVEIIEPDSLKAYLQKKVECFRK